MQWQTLADALFPQGNAITLKDDFLCGSAVVDGQTVYFGSENVENATGDHRRELGMIFQDDAITGHLRDVFERDWARPADALE